MNTFDPESHFGPEEYARIHHPNLERKAAAARAAAKRARTRGDDPQRQRELDALAAEATQAEADNRAYLDSFRSEPKAVTS